MTKDQIISSAGGFSAADRKSIALAFWPAVEEELDSAEPASESPEFWAEMDRRVAACDADPTRLLTREQFDAAVTARMAAIRSRRAP